ncbi:hypothetical protein FKW77_004608 [Venturia effusa]|uniref:Uncharacterized protein n=1 Tax=Venturia effusa TaxID=50376 RepID=A0A517L185_9PEZI|nr:hypothetical protein FKW77_004608 [Venturia effusa]
MKRKATNRIEEERSEDGKHKRTNEALKQKPMPTLPSLPSTNQRKGKTSVTISSHVTATKSIAVSDTKSGNKLRRESHRIIIAARAARATKTPNCEPALRHYEIDENYDEEDI